MYEVETTSGEKVRIGAGLLYRLRMWADWQIVQCGYKPESINDVCRMLDEREEKERYGRIGVA